MSTSSLAAWLSEQGLRNLPLGEMLDGFAHRLNDAGVPVARIFVGMNTLHSQVLWRSLVWDRATGPATRFEFQHDDVDRPIVRQSPFADMLRDGRFEWHLDLTQPIADGDRPVFEELRGLGMTDWLARIFPFGELTPGIDGPKAGGGVGQLWFACSFTTTRPGGFDTGHLQALKELLPLFALAVKAVTMRSVGQGLLEAYLGHDPAERVLSGAVQRGEVQGVEAVLFYADLRDFTAITDALPSAELIPLLDDCFDCMVRPVDRMGGEILKFLGDGLLGIFRIDSRHRDEICAAALTAASEALDLMDILAARRLTERKPTPGLDIALHVGTVQYGNVGTDTRLDFTVIGPAVNEASRIELLCKELGHPLLLSKTFADAAIANRAHLVSVGRHTLRGVREAAELFTLSPGSQR